MTFKLRIENKTAVYPCWDSSLSVGNVCELFKIEIKILDTWVYNQRHWTGACLKTGNETKFSWSKWTIPLKKTQVLSKKVLSFDMFHCSTLKA